MKKKISIFALILLLALSLCTPALAATEYGVIYDETDELGSAVLTMQGEETLPELSEKLGIDLRVDVLTQISYDSITETAAGIYARYNYGYGEEKDGVSLTIFMEPQDDGTYAIAIPESAARDQSYMLYRLDQSILSRLILPLGEFEKQDIRDTARELGLASADAPDSQEICFIPDGDYAGFIQNRGMESKSGHFIGPEGQDLVAH